MDAVRINPRLEPWAQAAFAHKIDLGAEQPFEPVIDFGQIEQRNALRCIKLHSDIDIRFRTGFVPRYRSEKRAAGDAQCA